MKSINKSKSSIEESTIITNPSFVYPQLLEYILLVPSPPKITSKCYITLLLFHNSLGFTSSYLTLSLIITSPSTLFPKPNISWYLYMLNVQVKLYKLLTL